MVKSNTISLTVTQAIGPIATLQMVENSGLTSGTTDTGFNFTVTARDSNNNLVTGTNNVSIFLFAGVNGGTATQRGSATLQAGGSVQFLAVKFTGAGTWAVFASSNSNGT